MSDYTKLPFYLGKQSVNLRGENYKNFIPEQPEIELKPKAKFFNLLVDINISSDSTSVYSSTWAKEFTDCLSKIHSKKSRLITLELGDSFSMAVSNDRDVYSWGMNDHKQCAILDKFSMGVQRVKNLSSNNVKLVSAG